MRSVIRFDIADSRGTSRLQQKLHLQILSKIRKKRQLNSLKVWTIFQALYDQIRNRYENSNYFRARFNKRETILCCSSKVKGGKEGKEKRSQCKLLFLAIPSFWSNNKFCQLCKKLLFTMEIKREKYFFKNLTVRDLFLHARTCIRET